MKIAIIFKPYRPLKIPFTGGMMNYVYFLAQGLKKQGHQITVFSGLDTKLSPGVKSIKSQYQASEMDVYQVGQKFYKEIENNFKYSKDIVNCSFGELSSRFDNKIETYLQFLTLAYQNFDLVHIVTHDIVGLYPALFTTKPTVISLHGHYDFLGPDFLRMLKFIKTNKIKYNCYFVSVSKYIQKEYSKFINSQVIYNAVDLNYYKLNKNKKDYLIWIGRIDYNKGLDQAIKIAIKLKQKLYFAGPIEDEYLYNTKIKKYIDGKNIKYLGIINEKQKNKYLGEAKAMFFPIRGVEAFGRVAVESLATGTPVITYKKGGLPEIVINNKTGFIVKENNLKDIKTAINNLPKISHKYCRQFIEDNFTLEKKINEYEKLYKKII